MSLRDDILALPASLLQARDDTAIAAQLSAGRSKLVPVEVGNGSILATIGLASGNALLDVIYNAPDYRYVKPLLDQGRLLINSPLAREALDALVSGSVITQPEADALKALAEVPAPVSVQQVSDILNAEGY